jgi:hypothetical protein
MNNHAKLPAHVLAMHRRARSAYRARFPHKTAPMSKAVSWYLRREGRKLAQEMMHTAHSEQYFLFAMELLESRGVVQKLGDGLWGVGGKA